MDPRRSIALGLLAFSASAAAAEAPPAQPPLFVTALPATVVLVAWLAVEKAPDQVDLDLRVEVVLPSNCRDRIAGLLRQTSGDDPWAVVVERNPVGACAKEPSRIAARQAIRVRLPVDGARELRFGDRSLKLARDRRGVTLDGERPAGDVPGAPPTGRPVALVAGAVTAAKLSVEKRIEGEPGAALDEFAVEARWPVCAGAPLGFLASGDASTHFALTRFQPIARLPLDERCAGTASRRSRLSALLRFPKGEPTIEARVGDRRFTLSKPAGAGAKAAATK